MYQLVFYVPEKDCEKVKNAIFKAGGGKYDKYSHCSWQTKGKGQFKPLKGSNPHIGSIDKIEHIEEVRVELIVNDKNLKYVIKNLKQAHPYEEPAYSYFKVNQ